MKTHNNYEQFGDEWKGEMMKCSKSQLVDWLRTAFIAKQESLNKVIPAAGKSKEEVLEFSLDLFPERDRFIDTMADGMYYRKDIVLFAMDLYRNQPAEVGKGTCKVTMMGTYDGYFSCRNNRNGNTIMQDEKYCKFCGRIIERTCNH